VIDETIFVIGGATDNWSNLNDIWTSEDKGQSWTQMQDAPFSERHGHSTSVIDGTIVVIGGINDD